LEAFDPGALLLDANTRSNAEATVTKADVTPVQDHRQHAGRWVRKAA
jgi:hypothetical protein